MPPPPSHLVDFFFSGVQALTVCAGVKTWEKPVCKPSVQTEQFQILGPVPHECCLLSAVTTRRECGGAVNCARVKILGKPFRSQRILSAHPLEIGVPSSSINVAFLLRFSLRRHENTALCTPLTPRVVCTCPRSTVAGIPVQCTSSNPEQP